MGWCRFACVVLGREARESGANGGAKDRQGVIKESSRSRVGGRIMNSLVQYIPSTWYNIVQSTICWLYTTILYLDDVGFFYGIRSGLGRGLKGTVVLYGIRSGLGLRGIVIFLWNAVRARVRVIRDAVVFLMEYGQS